MGDLFRGWYIKCQNDSQTLAFIAACHRADQGECCSLQVIMETGSWNISYPLTRFHIEKSELTIGPNTFSKNGCILNVQEDKLKISGTMRFASFQPLKYDIMGPFRYVPFLECRHSVFSMGHRVEGCVTINGEEICFSPGICYVEGDRGRSFPKEYLWTQCCFSGGSLMLSVADIPFCGFHFTGIISAIRYKGREYRLGTYLGARAVKIQDGEVVIKQGRKTLTARRLEDKGKPLTAPVGGSMKRTIRESASCRTYYHYQENGRTIFEFESDQAAFEYEYPQ